MTKPQRIILAIAAGIATALFILALFWCGGFDFNQRGETAWCCCFLTGLLSPLAALAAYLLSNPHNY